MRVNIKPTPNYRMRSRIERYCLVAEGDKIIKSLREDDEFLFCRS